MKRMHAVCEGHGEVDALPKLLYRILRHLDRSSWLVNTPVARLPRDSLVDASTQGLRKPPNAQGIAKAIGLARAARADALIVLVDADDDCPATFGAAANEIIRCATNGAAVMAVREFETWLLMTFSEEELGDLKAGNIEAKRDAKKALRALVPNYAPTTHQAKLVQRVDVAALRRRSASFDKLVREVDAVTR